jgi:hypothetical protein
MGKGMASGADMHVVMTVKEDVGNIQGWACPNLVGTEPEGPII